MNIPWLQKLQQFQPDDSAPAWSPLTYPDEKGFQKRIEGMIERVAEQGFRQRTKSRSRCPDTDKPVLTDALKGDTIASPYTGKLYTQGYTGHFGPRERNENGQITRYGGDPLKNDLPPALATLLLNPEDPEALRYLSQPGSMRQQYHFAAKNWARFYPILADVMGERWQREFAELVAVYKETQKPSDGKRDRGQWVGPPHTLVGEPGMLLGGNIANGGTENHKIMWRTSCLVYAQHFAEDAVISGHPIAEAKVLVSEMIRDFVQRLFRMGNGEYDSCTYYPHSIEGFLNLYDFSRDRELKELGHIALDYFLVTSGLKIIDGAPAGAQKRGFLPRTEQSEFESMLWAWINDTGRDVSQTVVPIHQITSLYRPNRVILNIMRKKISLPFECFMRRPSYHMDNPNCFQESFYCSTSFGLGNVAQTMIDNPTQQVVWSLVAKGKKGPLSFGGGQPQFLSPYGHSPYTQTIQRRSVLILATGQTAPMPAEKLTNEQAQRYRVAQRHLELLTVPAKSATEEEFRAFFDKAARSAASWLFVPKDLCLLHEGGRAFIEAHKTLIAVHSLTGTFDLLQPPENPPDGDNNAANGLFRFFDRYAVLVSSGNFSGYVLEAAEKSDYATLDNFAAAVKDATGLSTIDFDVHGRVAYHSLKGDRIELTYDPTGLRAAGAINGKPIDYDNWADGAVYESPYVRIKDGIMSITDGIEGYKMDFTGDRAVFEPI
ncbi:MAG: hypothetical protein GF344_05140 [Chitinivibrionales bacterium]|nr:hypothetical protein [Chitinivibrionales bacterium]MBD3356382.1 hypothetical protein [Chitinivibrionales bacterium]